MALMQLPTELHEHIIRCAFAEGFESLALTCKYFHTLCTPFLTDHNTLRWHFQDFHYYKTQFLKRHGWMFDCDAISSAFNLVAKIAVEPAVAHYIQKADFSGDSKVQMSEYRIWVADAPYDTAMMRLLADSPHLKQAGLDWKNYGTLMQEDINNSHYSQHAAVFALTLLPNVKSLILPRWWKPQAASDKLLDAIASKARNNPNCSTSLAQVTHLLCNYDAKSIFTLDWAAPFLTLPRIQHFAAIRCRGGIDRNTALKYEALESIFLFNAFIDEIEIARFLQNTPRLKLFEFHLSIQDTDHTQSWDLCQFVTAIEHKVGDHLVSLCVTLDHRNHTIVSPGRVSLSGFKSLERLQLPLEVVSCNLMAAASGFSESMIQDLVPALVTHLFFEAHGTDEDAKALASIFHDFSAVKAQAPCLKEIHLTLPSEATELYRDQFAKVSAEIKKAGVLFKQRDHIYNNFYWHNKLDFWSHNVARTYEYCGNA